MSGENTELDKTVMEKIGDPLVHLVRNALDHGIERRRCGWPPASPRRAPCTSTPTTRAATSSSRSATTAPASTGSGAAKAVERGLLSEADAATSPMSKVCDLIFQPGFSTAETVSDVSGRGVGMDVVRRNIQDLGGSVESVRDQKARVRASPSACR
jgi:two-component system, chemotaxis family, sensor kinase CheA